MSLITPLLNGYGVDNGLFKKNLTLFFVICLISLILSIFKEVIVLLAEKIFLNSTKSISLKIHNYVMNNIFNKPTSFFSEKNSGYISARIGELWDILNMLSPTLIETFVNIFELIGSIIIMINLNIKLTLLSLIPVPLMFFTVKFLIKKSSKFLDDSYEKQAELNSAINESFQGIEDIKCFFLEEKVIQNISNKSYSYVDFENRSLFMMKFTNQSISFISSIFIIILSYLCGRQTIYEDLPIGIYISFISYIQRVYLPIMSWTSVLNIFKQISVIKERVNELLHSNKSYKSVNNVRYAIKQINNIKMKDLSFRYSDEDVIKNFNLEAREGEIIIIKGKNGVGKSTVFKLLTGLYECKNGSIKINGIDLKNIDPQSIKSLISIVPQIPFLFNSSVQENITLGKYDNMKYRDALMFSGLYNEVNSIVNDKNKVGENGKCLSGGQKRKIAIARAIYKNFDLLLIDEALSNLDTISVNNFKDFLLNLKQINKIIIAIEHSDQLDEISDQVIWME